eukprot:2688890-Prymnesium_polylepis.1
MHSGRLITLFSAREPPLPSPKLLLAIIHATLAALCPSPLALRPLPPLALTPHPRPSPLSAPFQGNYFSPLSAPF